MSTSEGIVVPPKAVLAVAAVIAAAAMTAAVSIGFAADGDGDARIYEGVGWNDEVTDSGRYAQEALAHAAPGGDGAYDESSRGEASGRGEARCDGPECAVMGARGAGDRGRHARVDRARGPRSIIGTRSRRGGLGGGASGGRGSQDELEAAESEDAEHADIRQYLTDYDESAEELLSITDVLARPSNVVAEEDHVSLVAWELREAEPRGSYLYSVQQDHAGRLVQVHRYFCPQRRLDILAEACVPIGSVFSDGGRPIAVGYSEEGAPIEGAAEDLDPSMFSRGGGYVEANDYLLFLQAYFDSLR